jgi:hypothetical protein
VLGLNPDQLDSLLSLLEHPNFRLYRQALEELAAIQARPLLAGLLEHEKYLYQAGAFDAIRRIIHLPDALINHRRPTNDRTPDTPVNQFTNTPWYDIARANGSRKSTG